MARIKRRACLTFPPTATEVEAIDRASRAAWAAVSARRRTGTRAGLRRLPSSGNSGREIPTRRTKSKGTWSPQTLLTATTAVATTISVLCGLAATLILAGLAERLPDAFGAPVIRPAVVAGLTAALGLGIAVPQRFALVVCAAAWARFVRRGTPSDMSGLFLRQSSTDRPLYWIVAAVVSVLAGVSAALLPIGVKSVSLVQGALNEHFVWSNVFLPLVQGTLAFLLGCVPLGLLGMVVVCAHHLSCRATVWESRCTAWFLSGGGLGLVGAALILRHTNKGNLSLLVGALPSLLTALISVVAATADGQSAQRRDARHEGRLPAIADEHPWILRAASFILVVSTAASVAVWLGLLGKQTNLTGLIVAAMLCALGSGFLIGGQQADGGPRPLTRLGAACCVTALTLIGGFSAVFAGWLPWLRISTLTAALGVGAFGYTIGLNQEMQLRCVAGRGRAAALSLGKAIALSGFVAALAFAAIYFTFTPALILLPGAAATMALGAALLCRGRDLVTHQS